MKSFRNLLRFSQSTATRGLLGGRTALPLCKSVVGVLTAAGTTILASSFSTARPSVLAEEKEKTMYYRLLGNTGLQVSVLSYGFWATYGSKEDLTDTAGIEMAKRCLRVVRDAGVNLFDHAEVYGTPRGEAERIFGEALTALMSEDPVKWRRSDLIITTKIFWGGDGVNEKGLSLKHAREGIDASLKRLKLDYVDIVFCHRPDPQTPTETVVRAMTALVRSGKAHGWGTSEWSAQQITEAFWIAKEQGLEPPQFEQPQYHMFHRERFEKEYFPMFQPPYNMGTTTWSPLASGLLTGKYNESIPAGSRLTAPGMEWLVKRLELWNSNGTIAKTKKLEEYAKAELNCSLGQMALAWCVKNKNVSTVLLGATKPEQLVENLGAIAVARRMTVAHMKDIDQILGSKPDDYLGFGGPHVVRGLDTM